MPEVGKLEVLFVAQLKQFGKDIDGAIAKLKAFGKAVAENLASIERGLKEAGEKLTKFVTLPVLAFSAAAIKAADPAGQFTRELRDLGSEALRSIEPIGKVLIDLFREATPIIRTGIGIVRELSEQFAALTPESQKLIVNIVAIAAATGPALLVAAGAVAVLNNTIIPVIRLVGSAVITLITTLGSLTVSLVLALPTIVAWGIAITAAASAASFLWVAGKYVYENWDKVRALVIDLSEEWEKFWAMMKTRAEMAWQAAKGFVGLGDGGTAAAKALGEELQGIEKYYARQREILAAKPEGRTMAQILEDDLAAVKAAIASVTPDLGAIRDKLVGVKDDIVKQIEDLLQRSKKWTDENQVFQKRWIDFTVKVEDKIKSMASSVGDAFADLALDGENSFKALAKAFEKALISMAATQFLFQPLFDAIGSGVGSYLRGTPPTTTPNTAPGGIGPPDTRNFSARLKAATSGVTVNVIDQRSGGGSIDVAQRDGGIDIIVRDAVRKLIRSGDLDKDMKLAYGTSRAGRL